MKSSQSVPEVGEARMDEDNKKDPLIHLDATDFNDWPDEGDVNEGLLTNRPERIRQDVPLRSRKDWLRPYWLGMGLFLILFSFWLLDSLKDPILGALTGSNLDQHQPPAKLFSVCTTLALVCFLEYISHERGRQQHQKYEWQRTANDVLDSGGNWARMNLESGETSDISNLKAEDRVPANIFVYIGVPYCLLFGLMAYVLQFNPAVALTKGTAESSDKITIWHVVGYILYAAIESFGSIAVASFWSYVNSTLSLEDAERFYGLIIAIAQLGAIGGSTMVTTHLWNNITLIVLACLVILLHILVMTTYSRRFEPTSSVAHQEQDDNVYGGTSREPTLWSGVYLILKYNYVLLILGVSCLYEVSLTCLNYQMTLLGYNRFEQTEHEGMSFTQFMGHYGQMVNISSLLLSSIAFRWLIRRVGLRHTLRLFPTLLLLANVVAFGALPGNLTVLFLSMSLLKAMTYSIHDPSKEILYLPTSNAIKFKSKFWIDVVGARIAKAIGSSINTYAGSVDRSIRVASAPSLLTAAALWYVCYRVGALFDRLVETDTVVGLGAGNLKSDYSHLATVAEAGYEDGIEEDDELFESPTSPPIELSRLK